MHHSCALSTQPQLFYSEDTEKCILIKAFLLSFRACITMNQLNRLLILLPCFMVVMGNRMKRSLPQRGQQYGILAEYLPTISTIEVQYLHLNS